MDPLSKDRADLPLNEAPPAAPGGRIIAIQILRVFAILMIVMAHAQRDVAAMALDLGRRFSPTHILPWGAGIDCFFVICGFVIVYASAPFFAARHGPARFLWRRITRIVPLYWLFLTAVIAMKAVAPGQMERLFVTVPSVLASYFFWPYDTYVTGHPQPLYAVGWALDYAMAFYVLFAAALIFRRAVAIALVSVVLVLVAASAPLWPATSTALHVWSRPIVLEFAFGMGLAVMKLRGISLGRLGAAALVIFGLFALWFCPLNSVAPFGRVHANGWFRLFGWGVPAAALVAAAALSRAGGTNFASRAVARLGDASYALYLSHPLVLILVGKVWLWAHLDAKLGLWPLVGLDLLIASAVALVLRAWIEVPLTTALRVITGSKTSRMREPASAKLPVRN